MTETSLQRVLVFALRLFLGWVFLYAGFRQVFLVDNFTAATFLKDAKTFKDFYAFFASPEVVVYASFLVKWGHLLIGLSLVSGLLVRVSAPAGALLLMMYYFPRMDFPYVSGVSQFIVEYHLVYATVLVYLAAAHAGRIFGLDGIIPRLAPVAGLLKRSPQLRPLFG